MANVINLDDFREENLDIETLDKGQLLELRAKYQEKIAKLDAKEPKRMTGEAYEDWADLHEELEDILDEIMDRLDELN